MKHLLSPFFLSLALVGCGGGGDGGGNSGIIEPPLVPINAYAVAEANFRLLSNARTWETSGVGSDGVAYNFTLSLRPLGDGIFPVTGEIGAQVEQSNVIVDQNGGTVVSTTVQYFNSSTDRLIGSFSPDSNTCTRVDSNTALPELAEPGTGGALFSDSPLSGCDINSVVIGTEVVTWSLEVEGTGNDVVVLFCRNANVRSVGSSAAPDTVDLCVEIAPDGTPLSRARLAVTVPSLAFSLVTRNY